MLQKPMALPIRHKDVSVVSLMFLLLLSVLCLFSGTFGLGVGIAHGGGIARSCRELIVFEGNVNNYVKQFTGVKDPSLPLDQAGKMLSLLIQLDGLYSQIGYGSLGYVYIQTEHDDPDTCLNELILRRIMGEECCANGKLQEGRAALLLSGQFQNVKDQIYLLISLEFLRKGISETSLIPSGVAAENQISFVTRLPVTKVTFAPRKFTERQLYQVANAYSDVMYVRAQPNIDAKMRKIEPFDIDGFFYYIEEVREDWLKIRSYRSRLPSGWIKVPHDIGGLGLRELLPELYFMDATALYMQIRIAGVDFSSKRYAQYLEKFEYLMRAFEKRTQRPSDRYALGLLKSMHAMLMLERSGLKTTEGEMKKISAAAFEAAELLPTSGEAQSMAALTRFAALIQSGDVSFSRAASSLEKNLLKILSTDPANVYVKANLERLWRIRISNDKSNWQTDKLIALRKRFLQNKRVQQLVR